MTNTFFPFSLPILDSSRRFTISSLWEPQIGFTNYPISFLKYNLDAYSKRRRLERDSYNRPILTDYLRTLSEFFIIPPVHEDFIENYFEEDVREYNKDEDKDRREVNRRQIRNKRY